LAVSFKGAQSGFVGTCADVDHQSKISRSGLFNPGGGLPKTVSPANSVAILAQGFPTQDLLFLAFLLSLAFAWDVFWSRRSAGTGESVT